MDVALEGVIRYLDSFSLLDLQSRIRTYRRTPIAKMSDEEARDALWKIIAPSSHAAYIPLTGQYPTGTIFWRARRLALEDHILPLRDMRTQKDVWEPPAKSVTVRGRLNLVGESLLYTCPADASLTVKEARIPAGQMFSLIKYKSVQPVNVVQVIAADTAGWGLSEEQRSKYDMLMDFFETELTRDVGEGNEHLYRTSEFIVKDHFDLPPAVQDAWLYPSTVGKPSVNVTFRSTSAHSKLELVGVALCKWQADEEETLLEGYAFTDGSLSDDETFVWTTMGTSIQEDRFPEFGHSSNRGQILTSDATS